MEPMPNSRAGWLAPLGTILAVFACYGTLASVGILSVMGISISVPDGIWAGAIALFTLIAFAGIVHGWRGHRAPLSFLFGLAGTALVLWAMAISYSRAVEIAGFVCLALGAALDWRARRNRRSAATVV
jgi:hypothetical protein